MRLFASSNNARRMVTIVCVAMLLAMPIRGLAQDEPPAATPVAEQVVEPVAQLPAAETPPPAPGALQILLSSGTGTPLAGTFALTDAAGAYQEVWVDGGATIGNLPPGPASVIQLTGTLDHGFDASAIQTADVPTGGVATLSIMNILLDADGDGVGDTQDACAGGDDAVDTDGDGTADACDDTPNGDPVEVEPTPSDDDTAAEETPVTPTPLDDIPAEPANEPAELSVAVEDDTIVVAEAPVSCDMAEATAPWIASDLDDYPPGALVTLTGGGWVPGQTVELLVEDDGIADAEMGPWSHAATVTADQQGAILYQFDLAPWFVANYSVVATGECSEARTEFTDSVSGGDCIQVTASDVVSTGQYIMFRCPSATNPIRIGVTSISPGWQWAFQFSNVTNLTPPAYSSLSWTSSGTSGDSSASGSISQAYFFLSPTSSVQHGSVGTVTVQIKNPSGNAVNYTSTLTAYRAVAQSDFTLACTPTSITVQAASTQTVTCTLTAVNVASTASVSVSIPAITAPSGWTTTAPNPSSGVVTPGSPLVFTFSLTPSCTASTTAQSISVLSTITFRTVSATGPSVSVLITRSATTTVSAAISSSTLAWSRPYAFTAYPTNTGALTYSIQASGCAGWNITVAASPFTRAGSARTIPASNLTLTSSSAPGGTGISRPVTSGTLNSSLKVLSASASNGVGTFSQTLNLNLSIPAGTPVGAYTSTVTISAASGP